MFDRILVDAPCTGTGTLARNPEIKWRVTMEEIQRHAARQVQILTHALAALKPGGRRDVAVNTSAFIGISIPPYVSAIILQLLFGNNTQFLGDVAGNIMKFIGAFGGQGLVGLVAIGVVLYILNRR